ncbi:MAG TPA: nickel-type superoxide dismutase maturation protease [Candidatus Limnocylindria bacterium]
MSATRGRVRPLAILLGAAAGAGAALLAIRRLDAVEVSGASMAPALQPGDRLLVESLTYTLRAPRAGEIVLAPDPRQPDRELIKRVAAVGTAGIHLQGDHPAASTDSRAFGAVSAAAVRWRVALRYWPPLRIGAVGSATGAGAPWLDVEQGGEPACAAFGDLVVGAD